MKTEKSEPGQRSPGQPSTQHVVGPTTHVTASSCPPMWAASMPSLTPSGSACAVGSRPRHRKEPWKSGGPSPTHAWRTREK
jgi:hypothetical protein